MRFHCCDEVFKKMRDPIQCIAEVFSLGHKINKIIITERGNQITSIKC